MVCEFALFEWFNWSLRQVSWEKKLLPVQKYTMYFSTFRHQECGSRTSNVWLIKIRIIVNHAIFVTMKGLEDLLMCSSKNSVGVSWGEVLSRLYYAHIRWINILIQVLRLNFWIRAYAVSSLVSIGPRIHCLFPRNSMCFIVLQWTVVHRLVCAFISGDGCLLSRQWDWICETCGQPQRRWPLCHMHLLPEQKLGRQGMQNVPTFSGTFHLFSFLWFCCEEIQV